MYVTSQLLTSYCPQKAQKDHCKCENILWDNVKHNKAPNVSLHLPSINIEQFSRSPLELTEVQTGTYSIANKMKLQTYYHYREIAL